MFKTAVTAAALAAVLAPGAASAKTANQLHITAKAASVLDTQTKQRFGSTEPITVHVFVRGQDLAQDQPTGCLARYYGQGVVVRVNTCGKGRQPFRIRIANTNDRTMRVTVKWTRTTGTIPSTD